MLIMTVNVGKIHVGLGDGGAGGKEGGDCGGGEGGLAGGGGAKRSVGASDPPPEKVIRCVSMETVAASVPSGAMTKFTVPTGTRERNLQNHGGGLAGEH